MKKTDVKSHHSAANRLAHPLKANYYSCFGKINKHLTWYTSSSILEKKKRTWHAFPFLKGGIGIKNNTSDQRET
jgi:hypothetical protein